MNQGLHRLVFSRRLGMRVPAAEHGPSQRRGRGARRRGLRASVAATGLAALAWLVAVLPAPAPAQTRAPLTFGGIPAAPANPLPQPYGTLRTPSGGFVNDPALRSFVADPALRGRVRWEVAPDGRSATFFQGDVDRVILNWDRFDIAAGHRVHFAQNTDPARYVSALNRIWSADPSLILGSLTADREVILVNANGVYFGRGARVDTGRFVATANGIADAVFERGLRNVTDAGSVFDGGAGTDYLQASRDAVVQVEAGAEIRSAAGGDVLLIAPRVANAGRIDTPGGQAILAAGERVYLMSSSDPAQRGLIVAVDPFTLADGRTPDDTLGVVENRADGRMSAGGTADAVAQRIDEIRADGGSVNLVGLTVRQAGVINATTAVKGANGVITLQAMSSTQAIGGGLAPVTETSRRGLVVEDGARARIGAGGGRVEIAAGSVTAVRPDAGGATQLAAEVFNPSRIRVEAERIAVGERARIEAPAGLVELLASADPVLSPLYRADGLFRPAADASAVIVAPGAEISVAGLAGVAVDGSRNQGSQRLFRIELADAPVQRDGPLYRQEVFFDRRDAATIAVADVAGSAASIGFTAAEQSTAGGRLRIESDGAVVIGEGARLDVSGGSVRVGETTLRESQLVRDGAVLRFSRARPGDRVDALLDEPLSRFSPAYDEGRDGGRLTLAARELALAGELAGRVVTGERQAAGLDARAAPATLAVGRGSGTGQYLAGLALTPAALPAIDAGWFADPFAASPGSLSPAALSLAAVTAGGFGALELRAGVVEQAGFASLDLGPGGALDILAGRVTLDGGWLASGGSLVVRTDLADAGSAESGLGDVEVSAATVLDVAGRWTNETFTGSAGSGATPDVAPRDGGRISLTAAHDLQLAPGARLDVSGGARLAANGQLSFGSAGALVLAAGRSDLFSTRLVIDGAVLAGFDAGRGGTLTLGGPGLLVAPAAASAEHRAAGGLALDPGFFSAGGFGTITVDAFGDVRIASGTRLEPVLASWLPAPGFRREPSGAMRDAVAVPVPLDESLADRAPVHLAFGATRTLDPGLGQPGGTLLVERGASILLEAGGTLALRATRDLRVGRDGGAPGEPAVLEAPGGALRLAVTGTRGAGSAAEALSDPVGFLPEQALWIGADARLSVAGTAELRPDPSPPTIATFGAPAGATTGARLTGTVLGGGSIEWTAQRGYVVAEAGSVTRLDGAAAALDLPGAAGPVTVARPAGRLSVSSPEGIVLDGIVSARAPVDGGGAPIADGGTLDVAIGNGGVQAFTAGTPYPDGERVVRVGAASPAGAALAPGDDLAAALGNGIAQLRPALLAEAGFDAVGLAAGDRIHFDTPTRLALPLAITLDAPVLAAAPGVAVDLAAHTLSAGDRSLVRAAPARDTLPRGDDSEGATTTLRLAGTTVDVVGRLALQGFDEARLEAAGELRFTAVAPSLTALAGTGQARLDFAGTLGLVSAQTFATTATQAFVQGGPSEPGGPDTSRIELGTTVGAAPMPAPLAVFGELSLAAASIEHAGVLRQPFGALTLAASERLTLVDGSVTSVSGAGAPGLYGSTVNLSQWLLPSGALAQALPTPKAVTLTAPVLDAAAGARADVAGGGDVLAWEFFAGVGGSQDVFEQPGVFAVLPDRARVAPLALAGGVVGLDAVPRELVVNMAGSGLAPGTYTLLPARYALLAPLLPGGAFLVRADGSGGTVIGAPRVRDDGSVVVAGSLRSAGSAHAGPPGQRIVVSPASVFGAASELRLTSTSALLDRQAAAVDGAAPERARDGGTLTVQATGDGAESTRWRAAIAAGSGGGSARSGSRAGTLEFGGSRIALLDDVARTPEATFGVAAATLAASDAGSVRIGARRSGGAGSGDVVELEAGGTQDVRIDLAGAALNLEELIVAARGQVTIADGTRLEAAATPTLGARTLRLSGDAAVAYVSANPLELDRRGATGAEGRLEVGAGAGFAGAAVGLDASAALVLAPDLRLDAAALALGAPALAIGRAAAPDGTTTVIDGALLDSLRTSRSLRLRSDTTLSFAGTQDWAARGADGVATAVLDTLELDTPRLALTAGADGSAARTDIAARELRLRNSSGSAGTPDAAVASGSLMLEALPSPQPGRTGGLTLGPGTVAIDSAEARLASRGDIVLDGAGGLAAAGALQLEAARLTATTAAEHAIEALGALAVLPRADGRTLGERAGLGAALSLAAERLQLDGRIELPSGALTLAARGTDTTQAAVRVGPGAVASVAGASIDNGAGFRADTAGGSIEVEAAAGRIELAGTLDASAARRPDGSRGEGDGGSVRLTATGGGGALVLDGGRLVADGGGRAQDRGGRLALDVRAAVDLETLAASAEGFGARWSLRQREGDLRFGGTLASARIELAADAGALHLEGAALDARAPDGGLVRLSAAGDLTLGAGTRIDAGATRGAGSDGLPAPRGGEVIVNTVGGRLNIDTGARVDTGDGRVTLRAVATDDGRGLALDPVDARALGAGEVVLEAVRSYGGAGADPITAVAAGTSRGSTLGQASLAADAEALAAGAAGALALLGIGEADAARFALRPGIEIRADGDLTITSAWNLATLRPGGEPVALTLRAAGDLRIAASVSDGFSSTANGAALASGADTAALRLVAGADFSAADPLATTEADADLALGAGVRVRTGASSIELAAARDLRFEGSGAGVAGVLVAGAALPEAADTLATLFASQAQKPVFTGGALRLDVAAGRDIVAPEAGQLVNNWLWRSGVLQPSGPDAGLYAASSHLAWWAEFGSFAQTLGAFGGSGLSVTAGRDIVNLQALLPSVAWADSRDPAAATLQQRGGGDLELRAGRDVLGGQFLVAGGEGRVAAGRAVGAAPGALNIADPVLAQLSGGRFTVQSRTSLALAGSFNPTVAPVPTTPTVRRNVSRFFFSWGEGAALELRAAGGDLRLAVPDIAGVSPYGLLNTASLLPSALAVLPPSLVAYAPGGDITLLGTRSAMLFPATQSDLLLWAGGDLQLGTGSDTRLAVADSALALWPDFRRPDTFAPILTNADSLLANTLADALPRQALRRGDALPTQVHAGGSLTGGGADARWLLAESARFTAGADVLGLWLVGQNLAASDRTSISAGRNLVAGVRSVIEVGGPGVLDVRAGRDVDLGTSRGLVTTGNRNSAALPAAGAAIRLAAATAATLDVGVLDELLQADADARALLEAFVAEQLAIAAPGFDAARAAFGNFPAAVQAAFGQRLQAEAVRRTYLDGPAPDAASVRAALQDGFERRKADLLAAGEAALAAGQPLLLPGRESLEGSELAGYLVSIRNLGFDGLDLDATVAERVASLAAVRDGWRDAVAVSLGAEAAELDALAASAPGDPLAQAWTAALARRDGEVFERWREQLLQLETVASARAASRFGRLALPMRLALFDQGFTAAALAGADSFVAQPVWPGAALMRHDGALEMTQSALITERGGDIALVNPGGAINVGLKQAADDGSPKGVIALGGGDVFGYARDDFQVNVQRVFIVGAGDMSIWSSRGDIDSGRGANTAVGAPPLAPRRSVDGVVFEIPAATTGSGLAIVPDASGRADGTIGLYPAFGEILALDAFIRAPRIELGAAVRGADNLGGGTVSGAAAAVVAPPPAVASPPPTGSETRGATEAAAAATEAARERSSLLTVELLGVGPGGDPCAGLAGPALDECRRRIANEPPRLRP